MFWHVGAPNFGDDFNPDLFQQLLKVRVRFATDQAKPHVLGMGSILGRATAASVIAGSGLIGPGTVPKQFGRVAAVRGALTRDLLGLPDSIALGDPMLAIALTVNKVARRSEGIALVPHVTNVTAFRRRFGRQFQIIDPGDDPIRVIEQIAGSAAVISQSLHGLIVADAMEVPNAWLAPSANMVGGEFKFEDYFSTVEGVKCRIAMEQIAAGETDVTRFAVNPYRFQLTSLRDALASAFADAG